ncbi:MAG: AI-2E family transporter [Clostridia bacterium]|nr:AI-2E family transporter [Clostridia bacterium]
MLKKFKDNKYAQISLWAGIVAIAVITFFLLITNISSVKSFLDRIFQVCSPLVYGFIIAYLINPILEFCETKILRFPEKSKRLMKWKRPIGVTLAMLFFLLLVSVFVGLVIPQVVRSFEELESQISGYIAAAQNMVDTLIREFPLFNGQYENLYEFLDVNELTTDVKGFIANFSRYLETGANYVINYAGRFVVEVKNALIGFIVAVYLLLAKEKLIAKFKKLCAAIFTRRHYLNLVYLVRYTDKTVGGFIIGKIIDSIIIGLLTFIVMSLFQMPFTPLISVIVGVTNVIPFFGPFIGAIPSAFIVLIADPPKTLWFLLMILIIQQLDGNVIGPKILGDSTGLSSLAVLISITIAGGFFGFAGMILGVPAAAVICALVRQKTDSRLRAKKAELSLDHYMTDPPPRDFDVEPIFIEKNEFVSGESEESAASESKTD